MAETANAETLVKQALPDISTDEGAFEVVRRAAKGDPDMLPLMRKVLDDPEQGQWLVERYGNSYQHARDELIKVAAGKNHVAAEALRRKIDGLRDEVAGPNASALERILAERVALCWLDVNESDRRLSDHSEMTIKQAAFREDRRDRAYRRFLAACKTLATVRKLGVPAIQVNVARQQVNVAGGSSR